MRDSRDLRAEHIRVARARLRIDQTELAAAAGVHQGTVSKAEAGRASDTIYDRLDVALAQLAKREVCS